MFGGGDGAEVVGKERVENKKEAGASRFVVCGFMG